MKNLKALLLCAVVAVPGYAQLLTGRISGTVIDASSAVVSGAHVEALNADTNLKLSTITSSNGIYQFANVPIGTYKVTVEQTGFQRQVFTAISVSANRTTTVDAKLAVATVASEVNVTAETPLVNQSRRDYRIRSRFEHH